jgi:DHA2 family multidrug resistance protein-like MFS transporter
MALGVALLRFAVPDQQLGAALGWNALVVALSSAAGPTIGAAILSIADWPWLFAVNLPVGLLVLVSARALPLVDKSWRKIDPVSVTLNAAVFAFFVVGAELLPTVFLASVVLLTAAVVSSVMLVRRESRKDVPLVPLDLLRDRSFRNSVAASVLLFSGVAAGLVALPFYLQHGLGCSAWMTGLYMTPWPLTVALTAPVAGRLANHYSTARLCAVGGVLLAVGLGIAALWPLQDHPLKLLPLTMVSGMGFGLFNVPNNRNMFLSVPRGRSGAAGGLQGTARLTGQTAGPLLMALLFVMTPVDLAPRVALGIAAVLTLIAGLVSGLGAGRAKRLPVIPHRSSARPGT